MLPDEMPPRGGPKNPSTGWCKVPLAVPFPPAVPFCIRIYTRMNPPPPPGRDSSVSVSSLLRVPLLYCFVLYCIVLYCIVLYVLCCEAVPVGVHLGALTGLIGLMEDGLF